MEQERYTETNSVISLAFYDWQADIDIFEIQRLLEQVVGLVGRPPDIATVDTEKSCRDYQYRNFVKRNLIQKIKWNSVYYLWKRKPDNLSDYAILIGGEIGNTRIFEFNLDYSAIYDANTTVRQISDIFVQSIQPIYGIGYTMPYSWGSPFFAHGIVASTFPPVDRMFYGPPERMRERSFAFGPVFLSNQRTRSLDTNIRDVFELNFLSKGHLARMVEGKTLDVWIAETGIGRLRKLTPATWLWEVPGDDIKKVRGPLIGAGLTVVKD